MDITITNNPYQNNFVLSDGTFRVAKLNNVEKRPRILDYFNKNMVQEEKKENVTPSVVEKPVEMEHNYDYLLEKLGLNMVSFAPACSIDGYRKIRADKERVASKALQIYNSIHHEDFAESKEFNEEVTPVVEVKEEVQSVPSVVEEKPIINEEYREPVTSRVRRLERTNEMPHIDVNNNMNISPEVVTQSLSRVARNASITQPIMENAPQHVEVGKEGEKLDKIASFSPVNNSLRVDADAVELARKERNAALEELQKSNEVIAFLQQELEKEKATVTQRRKEEIERLKFETQELNAQNFDNTTMINNLKEQLREYADEVSKYGDNSSGMRR